MTMTNEERENIIKSILPDIVNGESRPADSLSTNLPYSDKFPQLIDKDRASADLFNLITRQLLSNDKYLKKLILSSSAANNVYNQVVVNDIIVPRTINIAINNSPYLCLPPVEILKAGVPETNVSVKLNDFSASDEAQFSHTDNVEFGDSGMKLKNDYDVPMSIPVALGSAGYISQSDEIDFSVYKSVEGVDV